MNKTFLAFGAGLAVGIGGTYFYLKQKYEEKLSKQIQEIRRHYQEKEKTEEEPDEDPKTVEEMGENWKKGLVNFATRFEEAEERGKERIAYESIAKRYQESDKMRILGFDKSPVDPAEQESPPEDEPEEEIFTVSEEEIETYDNFEDINLTYYAEDDILCDDQEQVIEDPEVVIGDALTRFGLKSGYPDTVFVINKRVRAIFEVLMVEGSYQEIVLGMKKED